MPFKSTLAKKFEPLLERLEARFERQGNWHRAQFVRLKQFIWYGDMETTSHDAMVQYIHIGYELRFFIQREVYLQAKHDMLYSQLNKLNDNPDSTHPSDNISIWVTEMETYKKDLCSLLETIWYLERAAYHCIDAIPDGVTKRLLCAHERKKDWYLSEWLRAQCAGSGGCCGRQCGCCERARSQKRPDHRSHCTSMCLCCEEARGFSINVDKYEDDPMVNYGLLLDHGSVSDSYVTQWYNAYIWGADVKPFGGILAV
ncbi:hypothetical protein ASPCADRAFT_403058 [Aspergillus carbonarius ITEM 5010]|uniref:Uncharacterized protein n=1 Tax=Aspergillus carbonarius (strain ITEM 5010) TaxID=602072 RepID=A0A1R3RW88_ASPC5|nr:hypothetical protein ASPCADRAFT_403058 [Aspergillus carbonarius ITEM 5010]